MMRVLEIFLLSVLLACAALGKVHDSSSLFYRVKNLNDELNNLKDELAKESEVMMDDASASVYRCDFNGGECADDFKTTSSDPATFKWKKENMRTMRNQFRDRLSTTGSFMIAKINANQKKAVLTKEFTTKGSENCVSFQYFMNDRGGCDVARLTVSLECGNDEEIMLQESGSKGMIWTEYRFNVKKPVGTKCKIHWKAAKGLSKEGTLGIDNVQIIPHACPKEGVALPSALECSFGNGLCDWKASGSLPWKFAEWGTNSYETGPSRSSDAYRISHFNGKYMYFEASYAPEKTGILTSPKIISQTKQCMRVFINMNGEDMGELTINVDGKGKTINGNQGPDWFEETFDLPVGEEFDVVFKAKTGADFRSDIAIDNIVVREGVCADQNLITKCTYDEESENKTTTPCKLSTTGKCEFTTRKVVIDGVETTEMNVKREIGSCDRKNIATEFDFTSGDFNSERGSCLKFDYKVTGVNKFCRMYYTLKEEGGQTRRHHYDARDESSDVSFSRHLPFAIQPGKKYNIKIEVHINHHCSDISFANLRLESGVC